MAIYLFRREENGGLHGSECLPDSTVWNQGVNELTSAIDMIYKYNNVHTHTSSHGHKPIHTSSHIHTRHTQLKYTGCHTSSTLIQRKLLKEIRYSLNFIQFIIFLHKKECLKCFEKKEQISTTYIHNVIYVDIIMVQYIFVQSKKWYSQPSAHIYNSWNGNYDILLESKQWNIEQKQLTNFSQIAPIFICSLVQCNRNLYMY